MKVVEWLGWVIFGTLTVIVISKFGKQWDLSGRYCLPTTLLSADGKTHPDGSAVDDVTLALVRGGIEQEFWLVAAAVLLALVTALVVQMRRLHRMQKTALEREIRRIPGMWPPYDERK